VQEHQPPQPHKRTARTIFKAQVICTILCSLSCGIPILAILLPDTSNRDAPEGVLWLAAGAAFFGGVFGFLIGRVVGDLASLGKKSQEKF
jgi:hypothetical protein